MNRTNDLDSFRAKLKRHSLKATPQRIAVHEAMMRLGHASVDMVAADIAENSDTKITVASVYNILSNLADLGIYHRRMSCTNKMFFDVNTFPHSHMYDVENDAYKDVIDDELAQLVQSHLGGRRFRGYKVEGIDIQILVRPNSRKKK